jgi:hypothetical protein
MSDLNEGHVVLARLTDALFCSDLEIGQSPTRRQLAAAVRQALTTYRTWNGCTRAVVAVFAKMPAEAARREAWCRRLAEDALDTADPRLDISWMQ